MDFADLQAKSDQELQEALNKLMSELQADRFTMRTKQLKQVHTFADKRRAIARIKTILHARAQKKS